MFHSFIILYQLFIVGTSTSLLGRVEQPTLQFLDQLDPLIQLEQKGLFGCQVVSIIVALAIVIPPLGTAPILPPQEHLHADRHEVV